MTEPITDAELTALFSTDNKITGRALKLIYDAIIAIGGVQDLGDLVTAIEAVTTELTTLELDIEAILGALSLIKQSTAGGVQKVTIPADPFQVAGSAQACRSVLVVHTSDNALYMNLGAVATVNSWPIPKNTVIPVPVDNCSLLNFFGTAADTVRLLWRN